MRAAQTTSTTQNEAASQHVYKSKNTNSTRRVKEANKRSLRDGAPQSTSAIRRDMAKMKKIASLMDVVSSTAHALPRLFVSSRAVFYSGTKNRTLPNPILNGIMLSAVEDLSVIDTISGARLLSSTGDTLFILILRHDAIKKNTGVKKTLTSLHALDQVRSAAETREKSEDNGKYATVG